MVYFVPLSVCLYVRCDSCDCLLIWQDLVSEYSKELKKKSVIEGLLVIFNIWILIIIMMKYCIVAYWFYGHYAVSTFKSLWLFKNIKLPLSGRLCVGAPLLFFWFLLLTHFPVSVSANVRRPPPALPLLSLLHFPPPFLLPTLIWLQKIIIFVEDNSLW